MYNSRCLLPSFNHKARKFAEKYNVAGTVGSDAHAAFELGRSVMLLEQFEGPEEMRKIIRAAIPRLKWSPPWFHLTSRYASLVRKLKS